MQLAQEAIQRGPFGRRDLAEDAGVAYNTIREWALGRRSPSTDALGRLALALRKRSAELDRLAAKLERHVRGGEG